ncbi:nitrate transporter [Jimgerdemannia flammicorona]|uniref:Nitrate transporter n=2 Tax=Jimgerdemannia flammicorona TaxID=994334 RepID=A0A433QVJ3_9FUNG|nr:nitrate transporter [Jimgerdemannia flammicorona]
MPLIFNALSLQLPAHDAWRVAYVIPALICIVIGILDLYAADDCPEGDWLVRRKHRATLRLTEQRGADVKTTDHLTPTTPAKPTLTTPTPDEEDETLVEEPFEGVRASTAAVLAALSDVNVWVLMLQYALSFGLELAVDNVIAAFFRSRFGLDQTTAALLGSVFGLMNIFSRVSGGLISDALARRASRPAQGRILAQLGILTFEGLSLVTFSRVTGTLHGTMAMLVVFSFFTQAACGTTYALVPFVMPRTAGVVSGLVGAGGNAGGIWDGYGGRVSDDWVRNAGGFAVVRDYKDTGEDAVAYIIGRTWGVGLVAKRIDRTLIGSLRAPI